MSRLASSGVLFSMAPPASGKCSAGKKITVPQRSAPYLLTYLLPVTFAHPAMQPGKPNCERKLYGIVVVVVR